MSGSRPHLKILEEIEQTCVSGLVEVLRTEGVRYALWDMTVWHRDYDPRVRRSHADEEERRVGREMRVRMKNIAVGGLHEANKRQVREVTDALEEGPEGFYRSAS